jgi:hypothetical protein
MKKMTLDLDALTVESFDTSADLFRERGTVRGHDTIGEPAQSQKPTQCLCPPTSICINTVDTPTCVVTACNDVTCTCPPATGPTCEQPSCRWTLCDFSCDIHCA